jgi:hypothetical protein
LRGPATRTAAFPEPLSDRDRGPVQPPSQQCTSLAGEVRGPRAGSEPASEAPKDFPTRSHGPPRRGLAPGRAPRRPTQPQWRRLGGCPWAPSQPEALLAAGGGPGGSAACGWLARASIGRWRRGQTAPALSADPEPGRPPASSSPGLPPPGHRRWSGLGGSVLNLVKPELHTEVPDSKGAAG